MDQKIEKLKQDIKSYESNRFDDEFEYHKKIACTIEVVQPCY